MEILKVLLYVVEIVVCLLLGLAVMLQKPKEGGLGGAFGGGALEASLGADAGNVLIKATTILGTIFLVNTRCLALVISSKSNRSVASGQAEPAPQTESSEAPAAPAAE